MTKPAHAPIPPDYGIDAPGVRRGMLTAGVGGGALAALSALIASRTTGFASTTAHWTTGIATLAAVYGIGMGSYMTYGSKIGKLRTRERLLDLAQFITPWTGYEKVLDVGCGRGLMLVGAARRLTIGQAVGIDLWRAEDQTDNTPDAALENAQREGVSDRVHIETGDARALPFADSTFDVVLSHWVIHNLPELADRHQALDEMLRVLRPGGTLVLADIAHQADYLAHLAASLTDVHQFTGGPNPASSAS